MNFKLLIIILLLLVIIFFTIKSNFSDISNPVAVVKAADLISVANSGISLPKNTSGSTSNSIKFNLFKQACLNITDLGLYKTTNVSGGPNENLYYTNNEPMFLGWVPLQSILSRIGIIDPVNIGHSNMNNFLQEEHNAVNYDNSKCPNDPYSCYFSADKDTMRTPYTNFVSFVVNNKTNYKYGYIGPYAKYRCQSPYSNSTRIKNVFGDNAETPLLFIYYSGNTNPTNLQGFIPSTGNTPP